MWQVDCLFNISQYQLVDKILSEKSISVHILKKSSFLKIEALYNNKKYLTETLLNLKKNGLSNFLFFELNKKDWQSTNQNNTFRIRLDLINIYNASIKPNYNSNKDIVINTNYVFGDGHHESHR